MSSRGTDIWSIVLVTVIALVIWLWASDETRQPVERPATIQVVSADPQGLAVKPSKGFPITLKILGSVRALQEVQPQLRGNVTIQTGSSAVPNKVGEHLIDVAAALNASPIFNRTGATVIAADPPTVKIEINELQEVSVPVEVVVPGIKLQAAATVEPATATVRISGQASGRLTNLKLEAVVDPQVLAGLEQGKTQTIEGDWRIPQSFSSIADDIRIPPGRPKITLTPESQVSTTTVSRVPVQIAGLPSDLANYVVTIEESDAYLRDVRLTGPVDQIRRIQNNDEGVKIVAIVHLTSNDFALRVTRKAVSTWVLPPGVTFIADDLRSPPQVRLNIQDRRTTTP